MSNFHYAWCDGTCGQTKDSESSCSKDCPTTNKCRTCNTCEHYSFLNGICINPKITGIKPKMKGTDVCSFWEACH